MEKERNFQLKKKLEEKFPGKLLPNRTSKCINLISIITN